MVSDLVAQLAKGEERDELIGELGLLHAEDVRLLGGRPGKHPVEAGQRGKGVGSDLLAQAMRRAEALGCKRVELRLPGIRDHRHEFFEEQGFVPGGDALPAEALKPAL